MQPSNGAQDTIYLNLNHMPVSRNRNKKRKKRKSKNHRDVFEDNGIRIERIKNELFFINNRNKDEHEQYLEQFPEALNKVSATIDKNFQEILGIFTGYDKPHLLASLSLNYINKMLSLSDDGLSEVILEYGMSIATSDKNQSVEEAKTEVINKLISLLEQTRSAYQAKEIMTSVVSRTKIDATSMEDAIYGLRFKAVTDAINIRGDGYYEHVEKIFIEIFSQHDPFLLKHYGISAEDIPKVLIEFEMACSNMMNKSANNFNFEQMEVFFDWAEQKRIFPPIPSERNLRAFHSDNPDLSAMFGGSEQLAIKDRFRIVPRTEKQINVAKVLSMKFGENSSFISPPSNGHLLADTKINVKPILEDEDGNLYYFSIVLPSRNFIAIGQELIRSANPSYYNEYYLGKKRFQTRDNTFERIVEDTFKRFIPNVAFYPNVSYPLPKHDNSKLGNAEMDLLGISAHCTYLIEAKAGELNRAGKRGAIESLKSGLKKNVGKGVSQTRRALEYIETEDHPVFQSHDGTEILVNREKPIFKIIITLDPFAGLLTKVSDLEDASIFENDKEFPWTISIYNLLIFAEIIESEEDFIDYLSKRLPLNALHQFSTEDEINLLGHFLKHDLIFDKKKMKYDKFTLGRYLEDIDAYFYNKQKGIQRPRPKRKKTKN